MSNQQEDSQSKFCFASTLVAVIGGFAIFLVILAVAYLPNKGTAVGDGVKTPAERKALLAELRGKEQSSASSYAWLDRDKGVVRLPLDRAIELSIQDYNK